MIMPTTPIVFLLGPPGVGKSALGSWACKEMGLEFVDLAEADLERLSRVVADRAADVVELVLLNRIWAHFCQPLMRQRDADARAA